MHCPPGEALSEAPPAALSLLPFCASSNASAERARRNCVICSAYRSIAVRECKGTVAGARRSTFPGHLSTGDRGAVFL